MGGSKAKRPVYHNALQSCRFVPLCRGSAASPKSFASAMPHSRHALDRLLVSALAEFRQWLEEERTEWRGKERDCVNLFAHQFLLPKVRPGQAIEHFAQIGIEVGVPNPMAASDRRCRPSVSRDLVVWDRPGAVTWDDRWRPIHAPMAILEWKVRRKKRRSPVVDAKDIRWLRMFSKKYPQCLAYVVTVDFSTERNRLQWQRCPAIGPTSTTPGPGEGVD